MPLTMAVSTSGGVSLIDTLAAASQQLRPSEIVAFSGALGIALALLLIIGGKEAGGHKVLFCIGCLLGLTGVTTMALGIASW
jgi:hypothetical protein